MKVQVLSRAPYKNTFRMEGIFIWYVADLKLHGT